MSETIDVSRDAETGEVQQFTIIDDDGQPQLLKATVENMLLYDPENNLPFDGGLYGFMSGDEALLVQDEPELLVAPTNNEYCYLIRYRGDTIETTPKESGRVLQAIHDAIVADTEESRADSLIEVYDTIMAETVRKDVVNALRETFEEHTRIEETVSGWLVDDFFLVDWTASMYAATDDRSKRDVVRQGSAVVETDRSYEFVQISIRRDINPVAVGIGGETYRLTEREMLFLAKVRWLLARRHHHPDMSFWKYVDKYTSVDSATGDPEDDEEEPDLDSFSI